MVVSREIPLVAAADLPVVLELPGARVHENLAAVPRARIVHAAIECDDRAAALDALRAATVGRRHVAGTPLVDAVILEPCDGEQASPEGASGPPAPADSVAIESESSDEVHLRASLASDGYLVLADAYAPGWEVVIDGHAGRVHPANVAFRAVALRAGSHSVSFRYRPLPVRAGLWLASAAILVVAALWWTARNPSRALTGASAGSRPFRTGSR